MNKNLSRFLLSCCVLLSLSLGVKAQYVIAEADKEYDLYNYHKAIDLYEQAYKKKETLRAAERLGSCYAFVNDYKNAESWFAIASKMPGSKAENLLSYAKALQSNSKYTEARLTYQQYIREKKDVPEHLQDVWISSCDSAIKWMKSPKAIELINQQALNSAQSDWGATPYMGGVVFTSDRSSTILKSRDDKNGFLSFDTQNNPDAKVYGGTGNAYLKLYEKPQGTDSVRFFPIKTGNKYHVGSASFTSDGNTMYFTMTRITGELEKVNNKKTVNVEIFSSTKGADGVWGEPVPFAYNSVNEYSVGDPFITTDGESLYFASNMPGGAGGTDIYVCLKTDGGEWGKPVNLKQVNTEGNERSPIFDSNNNFYFSSDGHIGMGGLDVFRALREGESIGQIENLGYPFNSPQDDFGFSLNAKGGIVFLSSNRDGGKGSDDIYSVDIKMILAFKMIGSVYNKKTNEPIRGAIVTLDKVGGSSIKVETDENGSFRFNLNKESDYSLAGEKTGYRADRSEISTKGLMTSGVLTKDLYLEVVELNKAIRLENIYYDFDKWNIREDAAVELDKLVKIMKDNPTIWIELGSHTDSRGKDAFNLSLSQKRADAAVKYIISKGISKNRITAKGYGETQLLNKCGNDVDCTEAEHQLNRRTEFKIVKQ